VRRLRNQTTGLPVWWVEVLMLAVLYYAYTGSRSTADGSTAEAMRMGRDLLRFENFLHVDIELSLNRWLQRVPAVAVVCCYYYATLHFIVTPCLLVWTHRRNIRNYSQIRWTLVVTTLICLLGFFLFPTAPPRLLTGTSYTDTMAHFAGWGWWTGTASAAPHGLESITNQFAALPSLHCAWSLWCGFLLFRYGQHRVTRVLGVLYPAGTAFVVMSTANHYLLDAVAGWSVLAVSAGAVALVFHRLRRGSRLRPLSVPAPAGGGAGSDTGVGMVTYAVVPDAVVVSDAVVSDAVVSDAVAPVAVVSDAVPAGLSPADPPNPSDATQEAVRGRLPPAEQPQTPEQAVSPDNAHAR